MSNRAIRRAAERIALKAAKREQREQAQTTPSPNVNLAEEQNAAPSHPASDARLAANRENAQKSTGPRTNEGKATSALNAFKNGLTGTTMLFANSDELTRYYRHVDSYVTQFEPVGPEESALLQSIVDIRWKLNRIPGLEQAILASDSLNVLEQSPNLASPEAEMMLELTVRRRNEKELRNLQLTENRLARRRERETAELLRLQAARRAKEEEALAEAAKASLLAKHRNESLTTVPGLGFVFSEKRFATYMSRLNPAQRAKFLQDALTEVAEPLQTMEAAA